MLRVVQHQANHTLV